MKKVLSALVSISFLAVLVLPVMALAASCPQTCGSHTDLCTCGSSGNTVAGEYCCGACNSGAGRSYVSQTECLTALAAAQSGTGGDTGQPQPWFPTSIDTPQDIINLIDTIGRWIFTALLGIAAIFLVVAGFMFITASGNDEKVRSARKMLTGALIGVAIALAAQGLVSVIKGFLR